MKYLGLARPSNFWRWLILFSTILFSFPALKFWLRLLLPICISAVLQISQFRLPPSLALRFPSQWDYCLMRFTHYRFHSIISMDLMTGVLIARRPPVGKSAHSSGSFASFLLPKTELLFLFFVLREVFFYLQIWISFSAKRSIAQSHAWRRPAEAWLWLALASSASLIWEWAIQTTSLEWIQRRWTHL